MGGPKAHSSLRIFIREKWSIMIKNFKVLSFDYFSAGQGIGSLRQLR